LSLPSTTAKNSQTRLGAELSTRVESNLDYKHFILAQVTNTPDYNTEILITTVNIFTIQVTTRRQMFWSKNDYNCWTRVVVAIRDTHTRQLTG
jgi:hypothetical protein